MERRSQRSRGGPSAGTTRAETFRHRQPVAYWITIAIAALLLLAPLASALVIIFG